MKDLGERCEKLNEDLYRMERGYRIRRLEAFAREIESAARLQGRNEALEEAKEAVSKPVPGVTSEHAVTLMHACERITALAANGEGVAND